MSSDLTAKITRTFSWSRCLLLALLLGGLAGCGTSTAPSGNDNIAGTWLGPWTVTGLSANLTINMSLAQSGSTVTGTYKGSDAFSVVLTGKITGAVNSGTFAGNMTLDGCTGATAVITGPTGTMSMTWNSAQGFVGGATGCQSQTFKMVVQKQ